MKEFPKLLIANRNGEIFDVPFIRAAGMKGGEIFPLEVSDLAELHPDSELFMLPDRRPVGCDAGGKEAVRVLSDPFGSGSDCFPVAAFAAPGFSVSHNTAYEETKAAGQLPLFSYAAAAFYKGKFYAASFRVDSERRQELSGMNVDAVEENVRKYREYFPRNRLVRHLESCALKYGCPAAKNFFLERYEGPLPSSPECNARCIGCITHQPGNRCSVTQPRINFVPSPEEIAEVAVSHIKNARDPVVSFGQGCEGEPLMAGETLVKAVALVRKSTSKGVINMNTNASRPDILDRLFEAGLDSIRVSLNSVRKEYYDRYYLPSGYSFGDVMSSIRLAKKNGKFVSVNYLTFPGFTDSRGEFGALRDFVRDTDIDMVQWRNLNYDPAAYWRTMKLKVRSQDMRGMKETVHDIHAEFPCLMKGYFNPSRGRMKRHGDKVKRLEARG
ncbi:MAG: radical SAM protein [Candidatus Omnitrophica bacterium]|nr:radical SAM protein [Candidatus Omnitrophota bacterium]